MGRPERLGRLLLACVLATACATPALLADTVSLNLLLDPPSAQVNTFLITVTAQASGIVKSDSDSATLTGNALANLTFSLLPLTYQASVTGLEFTGGSVAMSNTSFVLDYGWLLGKINATGQGISGTLDTPLPPGTVSAGTFPAEQHNVILDHGTFSASGTGIVGGLFEPINMNLADAPITAAAVGVGQLSVVLAAIDGHSATYGVTMTLPVDFQETVLDDGSLYADVAGSGTVRASGQFGLQVPDPPRVDWTGGTDDRWEASGNWTAVVAPGPASTVVFDAVTPHPPTLHQDESVNRVEFRTAGWTILGSHTLTIGTRGITSTGAGANTIVSPVAIAVNCTWNTAAGNTLAVTGDLSAGNHALVKSGSGTLVLARARGLAGLTVSAGRLELLAGGDGVLATKALLVSPGATLDVADNALIVDFTSASPCSQVAAWIASGLGGGPTGYWDGPGMTSSAAAAQPQRLTAVGIVDNADPKTGGKTTFAGEAVDATSILVMYTWWGDANLDGVVDANDYDIIDKAYLFAPNPAAPWYTGDFDYDGTVDANDYDRIDRGYLFQTGPLGALGRVAPVPTPEPATLALLGLGVVAALAARGRRK